MDLAERYVAVRRATEALAEPLSPEDCGLQSMEDASPVKWHLAHTSWFFETLVLEPRAGYTAYAPEFRVLFNSYYHSVGEQYARPRRGMLSRPSFDEVLAYRRHVDAGVGRLLRGGADDATRAVVELGLHHEQQHQELVLMDVKHALSCHPLRPAYRDGPEPATGKAPPLRWFGLDAGLRELGAPAAGFAFDNERPRHPVWVGAFHLASRPATNEEFLAFVEDGGYARPELWLSDGWAVAQREGWRAPLYWQQRDGVWTRLAASGRHRVPPADPVTHVSYYEADAFARWSRARLPTEAEWESAAADAPLAGNFVESGALDPRPTPDRDDGPAGLFGDVWEWTASPYVAYPGFQPYDGSLAEYNGKFMSNQLVLRGGCCATPQSHVRASYRNFYYPHQRWMWSGIRLARDA